TILADRFPTARFDRRDADLDLVKLGAGNERQHLGLRDLQIDNRAVADIGPATRQSVGVVAIAFEIVAPGLAPEALGDGAAFDRHRRNGLSLLLELLQLLLGLAPPLRHRNIGPK